MSTSVRGSVRGLARGLIDYAGLFPPAELPLDAALDRYFTHRASGESWMLTRFLIPATRLDALAAQLEDRANTRALSLEAPLRVGVVAGPSTDRAEWRRVLTSTFDVIKRAAARPDLRIEALELKLPPPPPPPTTTTTATMTPPAEANWDPWIHEAFDERNVRGLELPLYFEAGLGENLDLWPGEVLVAVARAGGRYKIRMGGTTAAQVPGIDAVAFVIERLRDLALPWKATAGLHHPIRRWDPAIETWTHGFVNLFGAALLAARHGLGASQIAEILAEQDPAAFVFDDEEFAWRTFTLPIAELVSLRRRFATSFGSCSFDEPCDDLRALGWL